MPRLNVALNRLQFPNPILVASGTFGYAREMTPFVPLDRLGGIIPKTVTREPRMGNPPPRTVETSGGMLNSIGLDNDGLDYFCEKHLPYLLTLGAPIIANIAGRTVPEFVEMAARLGQEPRLAGIELNISCPNVTGGVDFGTDPRMAGEVVREVRAVCPLPVIAKLTPNVTDVVAIARAVAEAGADAVSAVNTLQGMAIDWRRRKPVLGNVIGGLSGPAIKPVALRMVWQIAKAGVIPVIGVGGIATLDDVMEFLIAGATAVQIGTANFYRPSGAADLIDQLDRTLADLGCADVNDVIGTLQTPAGGPVKCGP